MTQICSTSVESHHTVWMNRSFKSKVSLSHQFRSNSSLSAQNKHRPMADNTNRTSLQTHRARHAGNTGRPRPGGCQAAAVGSTQHKQTALLEKRERKSTKERLRPWTGGCWKGPRGGEDRPPEQDAFVAEPELQIRACVKEGLQLQNPSAAAVRVLQLLTCQEKCGPGPKT